MSDWYVRAVAHRQERMDAFYTAHGPCCAGCDWWHHINSLIGECHRSAPVAGDQRWAMVGIDSISMPLMAGHVMTRREHHCGEFVDTFDWSTLLADYRRRIGRSQHPGATPPAKD